MTNLARLELILEPKLGAAATGTPSSKKGCLPIVTLRPAGLRVLNGQLGAPILAA